MMSLQNFAAIKVAVEICNNHQLKKEILCVFGSVYDENKTDYADDRKEQWTEIVEKKVGIILDELCIKKELRGKVIGAVLLVGMRILIWAKYHETTLGFSRNYSFKFFNSSAFITPRGIVDCKKTAEEMLMDINLTIKQKYKLALLYCMNQHIPALDKQMTKEEKEEFYDPENPSRIQQPHFVKFWSYYLKDEVDKLRGETEPNLYWLQMAVKSGSKDVVKYCLKQTNLINDEGALIFAALEAVRNCLTSENGFYVFNLRGSEDGVSTPSWVDQWVPNYYYTEVICFLFSKMRQDTQIAFLKEDLKNHGEGHYEYSKVLKLFLDFPYQDYFLKTIRLMCHFLPHKSYVTILGNIAYKIVAPKKSDKYGEGLFYDYKTFLRVFLKQIPESNKRYIFRDFNFDRRNPLAIQNAGNILLYYLFTQENYTYQDKIIIEWLLDNATDEEKDNIISSEQGILTCIQLIQLRRWRLLDEFVSNCYTSEVKVQKFKKEFSISEKACNACIDFIANEEWYEVESFIRWSTLTNMEINKLKEKMMYSEYGKSACLKIISNDKNFTTIDKMIKWCFLTEEKEAQFKKKLLLSLQGMKECINLVIADKVELANEFTKWSLSSEEEIKQYKIDVANEQGRDICENLIYSYIRFPFNVKGIRKPQVYGGNWEGVEKFLTWCFTSEDEISNFKKSLTMRDVNGTRNHLRRIHLNLMVHNKWEEVEIFYTWLNLSIEEIRELKKETILSIHCMPYIHMSVTNPRHIFNCAGGKWERVELFLRWCLEDEYDVLEFKNNYDRVYGFKYYEDSGEDIPEWQKNNLIQFYLFIKEFINDFCQQ